MRARRRRRTGSRQRRGVALVVVLLLLLILATTGITYVALVGTGHDATIHQWQSLQALYAAEAGFEMAMQELAKGEDVDSDGTIGGISDDGNPANNPSVGLGTVDVSYSEGASRVVTATGRAGQAERVIQVTVQ